MMIGLPGSGKSTWAKHLAQGRSPLTIIATDRIRAQLYGDEAIQGVWLHIWQEVEAQLAHVVQQTQLGHVAGALYDATNTQRRGRQTVINTARRAGFTRIIGVCLEVPLAMCLTRNQQRSRQVPTEVMITMARQLAEAPPHEDEGFDALVRVGTVPFRFP